jgi:hypothetical protein
MHMKNSRKNETTPKRPVITASDQPAAAAPKPLSLIQLDNSEKLVLFFTTEMDGQTVHDLRISAITDPVQCLGADCLLCSLYGKAVTRELLPVYDLAAKAISVLSIPVLSFKPESVGARFLSILCRVGNGEKPVLSVTKSGRSGFSLTTPILVCDTIDAADQLRDFAQQMREDINDAADQLRDFANQLREKTIDLKAVFRRVENHELAAIKTIATRMQTKGIHLN